MMMMLTRASPASISPIASASSGRRRVIDRRINGRVMRAFGTTSAARRRRSERSRVVVRYERGLLTVRRASSSREDEDEDEEGETTTTTTTIRARSVMQTIGDNYFIFGIGAVLVAAQAPALRDAMDAALGVGGGGAETYAIAALFFIAGLGLPVDVLRDAASDVRLNAFVHAFIFVFPTTLVACAAPALQSTGWLDQNTLNGLFVMAALPTTVGSGVAFTQSAGGNFSAALLNSMSSNLLGIFLTPFLIHSFLGADSSVDPLASSSKLLLEAFLPVVLGMSLRRIPGVAQATSGALKEPSKFLSDTILLGIIAKTFVVAEKSEAGMLDLNAALHLVSALAVFMLIHKGTIFASAMAIDKFSRSDRVAALYMGSHKTLAFGLPLIRATFENDPNLTAYLLPLIVYHPMQILVSSLLVPPLKAYVRGETDEVSS